MSIIDDIRALGRDFRDPADVAQAISLVAADPAGRAKLIQEWQADTGLQMPDDLRNQLIMGELPPP